MKNFLDRGSDLKSSSNSCKFYVSVGQELQDLNRSREETSAEKSMPNLLEGEIIITEGNKVVFFPNVTDKTKGLLGNLYVTNFRFIFDAYEEDNSNRVESLHQRNNLLGDHGACLNNIDSLYQLHGEKKRKLFQDSQLTEKIKGLQIICKTMKVFTFNFDQSPITQGKNVAKTLLHHAFPGRHQLLFAYDYRLTNELVDSALYLLNCQRAKVLQSYVPPQSSFFSARWIINSGKKVEGVTLFSEKNEWENEIARTCSMSASNWRISTQNQRFQMSTSLPKWLVVPHSVLDCDFVTASQSFRCNRPPIWTWSSPNGAALVRMADLLPTITDRTQENRMLENIRKCHPYLKGPCIKYLDKELPSINELFQSYTKLRDLCMPENYRTFKFQDSHLYSKLESSKWLQHVSSCLKVVVDAGQEIQRGTTVVLQESDGRDMSAIISSLVQLVLDSYTRSILGFQSLIQKEWIALGHPFCTRLGHVRTNNAEQAPVFLLFLDCVWQLQNQFPSSFEFTETYLTTLWDSVHISIFDTFLFDCEKDRIDACVSSNERLQPRSIWDWKSQFSDKDIELFKNPLYSVTQLQNCFLNEKSGEKKADSVLLPEPSLPSIDLWMQCYFRWLPVLSIKSGGRPQVDIVHRELLKDIHSLLSDIHGNLNKNVGNCVLLNSTDATNSNSSSSSSNNNSGSNNINNNFNINNNGSKNNKKMGNHNNNISISGIGSEEINLNYSIRNKSGSNNNSITQDLSGFNRLTLLDLNSDRFFISESECLLKNKNIIDNFFPFVISNYTLSSASLANSSNLSEFDTQSVLNLTD